MALQRALSTRQIINKTILVPIEGTDPIQYVDSYEQISVHTTLDMNNFNTIYQYVDEYGNVDGNLSYVLLDNGQTLLLEQSYEELQSAYINYLNGG